MLTDEQLTEIWRRRQAITPGEWTIKAYGALGVFDIQTDEYVIADDCGALDAVFIANAPADIEALLIEVKRLRQILGTMSNTLTGRELRTLADEIAREYKTPQHDRESTELPPVIEDQLDSWESE